MISEYRPLKAAQDAGNGGDPDLIDLSKRVRRIQNYSAIVSK
jgi:hypothetical protein